MEQIHTNNIKFLKIKNDYGFSVSQLAIKMGSSIDIIKAYTCSPDTSRHAVVPDSRLLFLKLVVKEIHRNTKREHKKPLAKRVAKG